MGLCIALAIAGCGGGANIAPGSLPSQAVPASARMHPHSPYEFWLYNESATNTLHVEKRAGHCMAKELPSVDLAPKESKGYVVDTVGSGSCALLASYMVIHVRFEGNHINQFIEIKYEKPVVNSSEWKAINVGNKPFMNDADVRAPVRTHCGQSDKYKIECYVN